MILLLRLLLDDEAQDLIEYGLLTALISVGFLATIRLVGDNALAYWTQLVADLAAAL